jgi:phage terminase large subunit
MAMMTVTRGNKRPASQAQARAAWDATISREIRRRVDLAARVSASPRYQALTRGALADPATGLFTFVEDWAWTYDPRPQGDRPKDLPVVLWQKQAEYLQALQQVEDAGDDMVVDKSRDTGVTWLTVTYMVWRWLTVPGWAGSIGSRKADLMDRLGDPKSAFWKVEYVLKMLPAWMLPEGFTFRKHRHFARVVNPQTGSTITGEAGIQMGRGGRSSFYFLDEFGAMPFAATVMAAVADNAKSILYASTATGPGTEFYRLVHDVNIPRFRLSWKDDPRKTAEWREDYLRRYGPAITAREVDISYSGGVENEYIPHDWVRAAVDLDLPAAAYVGHPLVAGFDVADEGTSESALVTRQGAFVRSMESWKGQNVVDSTVRVIEALERLQVSRLQFDAIGVGAGATGTLNSRNGLTFDHHPVNVGMPATTRTYDDAPERPAKERFANLKAEAWWGLRVRFWNSWRYAQGEPVEPSSCISIPDDPVLIAQLSTPRMEASERGLIRVESKANLRKRGVNSPDRAEALMLAYFEAFQDDRPMIRVFGRADTGQPERSDW